MKDKKFLWLIAICFLVGVLEFLSLAEIRLPEPVAIPLFLAIILGIGYETLWHGVRALARLNFKSINLLMLLAVVGAFYLRKYEEATIIIVLYTLAEKLEDIGIEKSKSAMSALLEKMPALVNLKGHENPIPVDEVRAGDVMLIKPSDMIALDGKVVAGSSYVDESTITGEPLPTDKIAGDAVFAGTWNKQGYLEVVVLKTSSESTLAQIQKLTSQATKAKAKTQKFIEQFARYYTPIIVVMAVSWLLFLLLRLEVPFENALMGGLALIVIGCPCALVISTPISIYSAIGKASKQGAVIKGGRYLEALGQIKAIALDKTRTLTYGRPTVTDIIPFGGCTREHLLECAAGIEALSEHPLAQGIAAAAKDEKLVGHAVENFESHAGKGAKADCLVCSDAHHCIGKLAFILEEHVVPQEVIDTVERLQREGKTSLVVATHTGVEGVIALTDEIRKESYQLIEGLKKEGIHPLILTGDHRGAAEIVARTLGIDEVHADLLPEEKAAAIATLVANYSTVAMVGDGINDAPALALANVGIAMGSLGSDVALETASVVIMHDRLDAIPFLVRLGKKAMRTIQGNTILAIGVKVLFILLALAGLSNLALAIFADVGVTLIVILLSLRLMK